jgi:integral membrane protein
MGVLSNLLKNYEKFKPFTEAEAWGLFRIAAISEAVGWTILISGILISRYLTPGSNFAVQLAGHSHGVLFMIYISAVILLYPSQGWSLKRTLAAGLASIPPYGSLIFEQWASRKRMHKHFREKSALVTYYQLISADL